jgi:fatty acid desaturase
MNKPVLPREMFEVAPLRSAAFVAVAVGTFVAGGVGANLAIQSSLPLALKVLGCGLGILVACHGAHLMGFVGHEGIHANLHRNKQVSFLIGSFVSAATTFPALGYGAAHWNHHRYTNLDGDPDAALYVQFRTFLSRCLFARMKGSRSHMRNTLGLATGRGLPIGYGLPVSKPQAEWLARANLCFLAGWLLLYVTVGVWHPQVVLVGVVAPLLLLIPISGLRGYVEHAGTGRPDVSNARSWASPVYTALFCGNNLHLEHHLYPGVPCYRLPAVHRLLGERGFFDRADVHVDRSVRGPWRHATGASQYPLYAADGRDGDSPRTHVMFGEAPKPTTEVDRDEETSRVQPTGPS